MKNSRSELLLLLLLCFCGTNALGEDADNEPAAILEIGGAGSKNITESGSSFGATTAVEFTPIEKWLEIETGVTSLFTRHSTEWDIDLLFKKPWTLSKKAELMIGLGPEWVHTRTGGVSANALAGEAVLDFMFWPSAKRRFGWYLEPGFDYTFGHSHERSFGMTAGLLIAIR